VEDDGMKILGVSASNRKDGNSSLLLKEMFQGVSSVETKIIQVAELNIKPCELCFESCSAKPFECVIKDDFEVLFEEMKPADGIIFACPFYFYIPSKFQAFLERISCLDYFTQKKHGEGHNPFVGKPCLLIAVSASGSGFNAFQILHHLQEFALMFRMRLMTLNSWPFIGFSAKSGEIEKGAILKETEVTKQAKELLPLLITEIQKVG
jgi:multimeric flavodoxin WrbA